MHGLIHIIHQWKNDFFYEKSGQDGTRVLWSYDKRKKSKIIVDKIHENKLCEN